MNKKRGFTLIELLTVIAILAVILLISAPIILNVLDKARQNTFKNQALLYVEGLKQQAALSQVGEGNIVLPSNGSSIDIDITTINLEVEKDYTGTIRLTNNNGKYKYELINVTGDGYQANGPTNNIKVTKVGKTQDTPKKTSFVIGDEVTLKDNTTWYVIEDSNSSNSTVTLFASSNIKNDATGWTTEYSEYKIAFDEANARSTENNSYCTTPANGCNMYASNGTTVTEDSTIKKFLDGSVTTYINNSLKTNGGTNINSIRLITNQEICNIINASDSGNNCTLKLAHYFENGGRKLTDVFTNVPSWLYSTSYWTMTPNSYSTSTACNIYRDGNLHRTIATNNTDTGVRPVIVTNKSNIK